jgi:hypothetical protein
MTSDPKDVPQSDEGASTLVPNPGSAEAQAMGCDCPVMDNNRGKYPPRPPDGWFTYTDCPVHGMGPKGGPTWG